MPENTITLAGPEGLSARTIEAIIDVLRKHGAVYVAYQDCVRNFEDTPTLAGMLFG